MAVPKRRAIPPDEDLVRVYLADIGRHTLLTRDDEARLSRCIEDARRAAARLDDPAEVGTPAERRQLRRTVRHGAEAHEQFVSANLRLVVSIAKRYQRSGVPLLDLIQDGNEGLIHAVAKFDWRKGFKFSTYATWWIRQAISRGIANSSRTIRLPSHAHDRLAAVQRARTELETKLGRAASSAELADAIDVSEVQITDVMPYAQGTLSLSEPLGEDATTELGDLVEDRAQVSPCDAAVTGMLVDEIASVLHALDDRERLVISLRFGLDRAEPLSLADIGAQFQLSRERIRQIEARAMHKLRQPTATAVARSLLEG